MATVNAIAGVLNRRGPIRPSSSHQATASPPPKLMASTA
jgi:hypothetical protein